MAPKDKKRKPRTPRPPGVRSSAKPKQYLPEEVVQLGVEEQAEYDRRVNYLGENSDDVLAERDRLPVAPRAVPSKKSGYLGYRGKYGNIPKSVAQGGKQVAAIYDLAVNRDERMSPDAWNNSMYNTTRTAGGLTYLEVAQSYNTEDFAVTNRSSSGVEAFGTTDSPSTKRKMKANAAIDSRLEPLNDYDKQLFLHLLFPHLVNPPLKYAKEQAAEKGMSQKAIDSHDNVAFFVNGKALSGAGDLKKGSLKKQLEAGMQAYRRATELAWTGSEPTLGNSFYGTYEENWNNEDLGRSMAFWYKELGKSLKAANFAATTKANLTDDPLIPNQALQVDPAYAFHRGWKFETIAQARLLEDTREYEKQKIFTFEQADAIEMVKIQQQFPGISARVIAEIVQSGKTIETDSDFLATLSSMGGYADSGAYSRETGEKLSEFQLRRLVATGQYEEQEYRTKGDYKEYRATQIEISLDEAFYTNEETKKDKKEKEKNDDGFLGLDNSVLNFFADNPVSTLGKEALGTAANLANFPLQVLQNLVRFEGYTVGVVGRFINGDESWGEERARLTNNVLTAVGEKDRAKAEKSLAKFEAIAPTIENPVDALGNVVTGTNFYQADIAGLDDGGGNPILGPDIGSKADQEVGRLARSYGAFANTDAYWRKGSNEYTSYGYSAGRLPATLVSVPGSTEWLILSGLIDAPIALFADPLNKANPAKWIKAAKAITAMDASINAAQASYAVAKARTAAAAANGAGGLSGWLKAKMGVSTITEYLRSKKGQERIVTFANMAADQEYGRLLTAANNDASTVRLFGNAGSPEVLSGEATLETGYDSLVARESLRNLDNANTKVGRKPSFIEQEPTINEEPFTFSAPTEVERSEFYDALQADAKTAHASENPYEQFGIPGGTGLPLTADDLNKAQEAAKKSGTLDAFRKQVFGDFAYAKDSLMGVMADAFLADQKQINELITFSDEQIALINAAQDARNGVARERHIKFISGVVEQKHIDLWAAGKFSEKPPSIAKKAYLPMRVALFAGAGSVLTPQFLSPATDEFSDDDTTDRALQSLLGYLGFAIGFRGSKNWKFAPGFDMMPQFRIATKLGDKSDAMDQMRRIYVQGKMSVADMDAMVKDFATESFNMLGPITKAFHRIAVKTLTTGKSIKVLIEKYNLSSDADLFGKQTEAVDASKPYQRGALWEAAKKQGNKKDMKIIESQIQASDHIMQGITQQLNDFSEMSGIFHSGKYFNGSTEDQIFTKLDQIAQQGVIGDNKRKLAPSELPMLVSQFLSGDIPIPIDFARRLRNSTYRYGRLMQSRNPLVRGATLGGTTAGLYAYLDAGGDPEAFFDDPSIGGMLATGAAGALMGVGNQQTMRILDSFNSNVFKPFALVTRLAYPVRVISEEQVRMSAAGLSSMFSSPVSYFSWVMMAPNDIHRYNFAHSSNVNSEGFNHFIQASAARTGFQALFTPGVASFAKSGDKTVYDLLAKLGDEQKYWPTALADRLHIANMDTMARKIAQQVWYARKSNRPFELQKFIDDMWEEGSEDIIEWKQQIAAGKDIAIVASKEVWDDYLTAIYTQIVSHAELTANNYDLIEIIGFAHVTRNNVQIPLWNPNKTDPGRLINPEMEEIFQEALKQVKLQEGQVFWPVHSSRSIDPNVVLPTSSVADPVSPQQMKFEDVTEPTEDLPPTSENVVEAENPAVNAVLDEGEDLVFSKTGGISFWGKSGKPVGLSQSTPAEVILREVLDIKPFTPVKDQPLFQTGGTKQIPATPLSKKQIREGKKLPKKGFPARRASVFNVNNIPHPLFVQNIDLVFPKVEDSLSRLNQQLIDVTAEIDDYANRFPTKETGTVINVDDLDEDLQKLLREARHDLSFAISKELKDQGTWQPGNAVDFHKTFDERWAPIEAEIKKTHARAQAGGGSMPQNVSEQQAQMTKDKVIKKQLARAEAKAASDADYGNIKRQERLKREIQELEDLKIMATKIKNRRQFRVYAVGGRATTLDRGQIFKAFRPLYKRVMKGDEVVIILGDADGFDIVAAGVARSLGFTVEIVPVPKKGNVTIKIAENAEADETLKASAVTKDDVEAGSAASTQESALGAFERQELIASGGETGNALKLVFVFENPVTPSPGTIKAQGYYDKHNRFHSGRYVPGEGESRSSGRYADPLDEGYEGGDSKPNLIPSPDPSGKTPPKKGANAQAADQFEVDNFSATTQEHSFERGTRGEGDEYRQPPTSLGPEPYMSYNTQQPGTPNPELAVPIVKIQGKRHALTDHVGPKLVPEASRPDIRGRTLNSPQREDVSLAQLLSDGRARGFTLEEHGTQKYMEGQELVFKNPVTGESEVYGVSSRKKVDLSTKENAEAWSEIEGQLHKMMGDNNPSKLKIINSGHAYQYTVVKIDKAYAPRLSQPDSPSRSTLEDSDGLVPFYKQRQAEKIVKEFGHIPEHADPNLPAEISYTANGLNEVIASGYTRIVYTDRGPYLEISAAQSRDTFPLFADPEGLHTIEGDPAPAPLETVQNAPDPEKAATPAEFEQARQRGLRRAKIDDDNAYLAEVAKQESVEEAEARRIARNYEITGSDGRTIRFQYTSESRVVDPQPIPLPKNGKSRYDQSLMNIGVDKIMDERGSADFRADHWYVPMEDVSIKFPEGTSQNLEMKFMEQEADEWMANLGIDEAYSEEPGMSLQGVTRIEDLKTYDGVVVVVEGSPRYKELFAAFKRSSGKLQGDFVKRAGEKKGATEPWQWLGDSGEDDLGKPYRDNAPGMIIVIPRGTVPAVVVTDEQAAEYLDQLFIVREMIHESKMTDVIISPLGDANGHLYSKVEQMLLGLFRPTGGTETEVWIKKYTKVAVERSPNRELTMRSKLPNRISETTENELGAAYEPEYADPDWNFAKEASNRVEYEGVPYVSETEELLKRMLLFRQFDERRSMEEVDELINRALGYVARYPDAIPKLSPQGQNFAYAIENHFRNMPDEDLIDWVIGTHDNENDVKSLVDLAAAREILNQFITDSKFGIIGPPTGAVVDTFLSESGLTIENLIAYFKDPDAATGAGVALASDGFWRNALSGELMANLRADIPGVSNQAELVKYLDENVDVEKIKLRYAEELFRDIGREALDLPSYREFRPANTHFANMKFGIARTNRFDQPGFEDFDSRLVDEDEVAPIEVLREKVKSVAESELQKIDGAKEFASASKKWNKKFDAMDESELYGFLEWHYTKIFEAERSVWALSTQELFDPTLWGQLRRDISIRELMQESTLKPDNPMTLVNYIRNSSGDLLPIDPEALEEIERLRTTYNSIVDAVSPTVTPKEWKISKAKVLGAIDPRTQVFGIDKAYKIGSVEFNSKKRDLSDRIDLILSELKIEQPGSVISKEDQEWFADAMGELSVKIWKRGATSQDIYHIQRNMRRFTKALLDSPSLKWADKEYVVSALPEHIELMNAMDEPFEDAKYFEDFSSAELQRRMTNRPKKETVQDVPFPESLDREQTLFPTQFIGPKYQGKDTLGGFNHIKNEAFRWLAGVPTQVLSRSPVFRQIYWRRIVEEAQLMNPDDAQEVLKRAQREFEAFDLNLTAPAKVAAFSALGAAGMEIGSGEDRDRLSVEGLIGFVAGGAISMYAGRKVHYQVKSVIDVTGEAKADLIANYAQNDSFYAKVTDRPRGLYLNGEPVSRKTAMSTILSRTKRDEPLSFVLVTKNAIPRDTAIGQRLEKLNLWKPHDFTKIERAIKNGTNFSGDVSVGTILSPERKAAVDARTASGIPPRTLEEADQLAKEDALDGVLSLLYDLSNSTSIMDSLRIVLPFGEALSEMFKVWSRLTGQNPYSLRTGQKLLQGGEDIGFISTDDNGERVVNIPGSEYVTEFLTGTRFQIRLSLAGLTQAASPVGLSPLIQLPYALAADTVPSMDALRKFVLPIGAPASNNIGDAVGIILPSYLETAIQTAFGVGREDVTAQYMKVWGEILRMVLMQEHGNDNKILSPQGEYTDFKTMSSEDKDRIFEQVDDATKTTFILKALIQSSSPSSTKLELSATSWKGAEIPFAHLARLVSEAVKDSPNHQLPERMFEKYGPQIKSIMSLGVMPNRAAQPLLTKKGSKWDRDNKGLKSRVAPLAESAYGFFFPSDGKPDDVDNEAYRQAVDRGLIKLSTKDEMWARVTREWAEGIMNEAERDALKGLKELGLIVDIEKDWKIKYGSLEQALAQDPRGRALWEEEVNGGWSMYDRPWQKNLKLYFEDFEKQLRKDFSGYGNRVGEISGEEVDIQRAQVRKVAKTLGPNPKLNIDNFIKKGPADGQTQAEFNDDLLFLIIRKYENNVDTTETDWQGLDVQNNGVRGWQESKEEWAVKRRELLQDFFYRNIRKYEKATNGDIRLDNLKHYVYYKDATLPERYRSR